MLVTPATAPGPHIGLVWPFNSSSHFGDTFLFYFHDLAVYVVRRKNVFFFRGCADPKETLQTVHLPTCTHTATHRYQSCAVCGCHGRHQSHFPPCIVPVYRRLMCCGDDVLSPTLIIHCPRNGPLLSSGRKSNVNPFSLLAGIFFFHFSPTAAVPNSLREFRFSPPLDISKLCISSACMLIFVRSLHTFFSLICCALPQHFTFIFCSH